MKALAARNAARRWLPVIGVACALALWEMAARANLVDQKYLSAPSTLVRVLFSQLLQPGIWEATGRTLSTWIRGLAIGALGGAILGIVIGQSRFLLRATSSTIEFLRPIPSVALLPVAVLLFGIGPASTIFITVYAVLWQIIVQVLQGVQDVDPVTSNTTLTYGFGTMARIRYLIVPTILPYAMTGLRLGASTALVVTITAELVVGANGLGREIFLAQSGGAVDLMYARILWVGGLGVLINVLMRGLEKKVLFWHESVRGEQ